MPYLAVSKIIAKYWKMNTITSTKVCSHTSEWPRMGENILPIKGGKKLGNSSLKAACETRQEFVGVCCSSMIFFFLLTLECSGGVLGVVYSMQMQAADVLSYVQCARVAAWRECWERCDALRAECVCML